MPSEIALTTRVGGRLTPANTVNHTTSAAGVVKDIFVRVGQRVTAGERLFTVERDDLTGSYVPVLATARISGLVSSVAIKPNAAVRNGDQAVAIIDTSAFYLSALISDKDARSIPAGQTVQATVSSGPSIRGTVQAISPEPDYQTGLFTIDFRFTDVPLTALGQFSTVELPIGTVQGIFVSQSLLQRTYGRYQLWIVNGDNRLEARLVTIGAIYGDQVLIQDGLQAGERILLRRTGRERAGDLVEAAGRP
jgi:multidrug efflux pump subunit AcrA (membrane-fusion protein)